MQALHDVVKAGYVRYIGMSSCYAWQCAVLVLPTIRLLIVMNLHYIVHIMQSAVALCRNIYSSLMQNNLKITPSITD